MSKSEKLYQSIFGEKPVITNDEKNVLISQIEKIRKKLLELTARNRLLNFRFTKNSLKIIDELPHQVYKSLVLDDINMEFGPLPEPDLNFSSEKLSIDELKKIVAKKAGINIADDRIEENDTPQKKYYDKILQTNLFINELEARLRKINAIAKSFIEETGQNQLFLALGFLEWKETEQAEKTNKAPLILIPVELDRKIRRSKNYIYYVKYTGEDIIENISLSEKLQIDFNIHLPKLDDESVVIIEENEPVLDVNKYFDAVENIVQDRTHWKISWNITLGFFSFSKLLMYKDLDPKSWPSNANIVNHPIVSQIILGKDEPIATTTWNNNDIDEENIIKTLPLVLDADGSQISNIVKAINGNNLVILGPPGTGKSQTITNLISCFMNQGKTVLFVAEKMAALNIVRRNLEKVGLGEFCLELHSNKARKRDVSDQLNKRLSLNCLDSNELSSLKHNLLERRSIIQDYIEKLHKRNEPIGQSLYQIIGKAELYRSELKDEQIDNLIFDVENVDNIKSDDITIRTDLLDQFPHYLKELGTPIDNVWFPYKAYSIQNDDDVSQIKAYLHKIKVNIERLIEISNAIIKRLEPIEIETSDINLDILNKLSHVNSITAPEVINQNILIEIRKHDLTEIKDLLGQLESSIREYKELISDIDREGFVNEEISKLDDIDRFTNFLNKYATSSDLAEITLQQLSEVDTQYKSLIDSIDKSFKKFPVLSPGYTELPKTLDEAYKLLNLLELMNHKPSSVEELKLEYVFLDGIDKFERKILNLECKIKGLKERENRLSEVFSLLDLPNKNQLPWLRKTIRLYKGRFYSFLISDYRKAKNLLFTFLNDRSYFKSNKLINQIGELEKFITDRENLRNSSDYKEILGQKFEDERTNYQELKQAIDWLKKLRDLTPSDTEAKKIALITREGLLNLSEIMQLRDSLKNIENDFKKISSLSKDTYKSNDDINFTPIGQITDYTEDIVNEIIRFKNKFFNYILDRNKTTKQIESLIAKILSAKELKNAINNNSNYSRLLGNHFKNTDTDIRAFNQHIQLIESLININLPIKIYEKVAYVDTQETINLLRNHSEEIGELIREVISNFENFQKYGELDLEALFGDNLESISLDDAISKIEELLNNTYQLINWSQYCHLVKNTSELGLSYFVDLIQRGKVKHENITTIYLFNVYRSLLRINIAKYPSIEQFSRVQHEENIRKFIELDKNIQNLLAKRIAYNASRKEPPRGISRGLRKTWTELSLVKAEINSRRRHIPLRQLLNRAGDTIKTIKPVFLMSPLSVAHFLEPGKHEFDVVIMDEASQIKPVDALGSIARGKQLIVVGDPKQLPPTSFFEKMSIEDDDDESSIAEEDESILDSCLTSQFIKDELLWHYRSEHESLISFSNSYFYDNRLRIFPSTKDNKELGVFFHYIDNGIYSSRKKESQNPGGRNEVEGMKVANAIIKHAKNNPELSLGVGTFNIEQRDYIEGYLERLVKQDPSNEIALEQLQKANNGNEPLFIKNLENLQGDERDVIFISCTFGPEKESGVVRQRFGPVASKHGPRRLNVLFTRAKKRMEIFSSMNPEDIKAGPQASEGANVFKKYLKYCQSGILPDYGTITSREPGSPFQIAVGSVLKSRGYNIEYEVGVAGFFIDIGVYHPYKDDSFILGIETDGATYHSSKYARDRDRLRQEVLENREWIIHRIWSTDWFRNRDSEINRLIKKLNDLVEEGKHTFYPKKEITVDDDISIPEKKSSTDEYLKDKLIKYRVQNSLKTVLNDQILDYFIKNRPTDNDEFLKIIPSDLRYKIDPDEAQYLADIFTIIEGSLD